MSRARAASPGAMHSLLVKPLADSPQETERSPRYFADGLTEALIAAIGQTGLDRVIATTSALEAGREPRRTTEIASQMNVDGVLEGTVSRSGGRVALSVRLLNAADGREVWATSQERPVREVAALVASIAAAVAAAMQHAPPEDVARRLAGVRAVSPDVQEAYLERAVRVEPAQRSVARPRRRALPVGAPHGPDIRPCRIGARRLLQPVGHGHGRERLTGAVSADGRRIGHPGAANRQQPVRRARDPRVRQALRLAVAGERAGVQSGDPPEPQQRAGAHPVREPAREPAAVPRGASRGRAGP